MLSCISCRHYNEIWCTCHVINRKVYPICICKEYDYQYSKQNVTVVTPTRGGTSLDHHVETRYIPKYNTINAKNAARVFAFKYSKPKNRHIKVASNWMYPANYKVSIKRSVSRMMNSARHTDSGTYFAFIVDPITKQVSYQNIASLGSGSSTVDF
jgi:hypothetical protein